jgi:polar amino acid transport system substrate-binding protein/glutamate/aspartate transport system substrate-binding protein
MTRLLLCICAAALMAPAAPAQESVRIGFRADTPPFSSSGAGILFEGFLVRLCRQAFATPEWRIVEVEVTAESRFDQLSAPEGPESVDLLCDPTSVTPDRAETYLFSPLVFVTGVGFLMNRTPGGEQVGTLQELKVGYLGNTTAAAAVDLAEARGDLNQTESQDIVRIDPNDQGQRIGDHRDGVARLCRGELTYYFGDRDILGAVLDTTPPDLRATCPDITMSRETYSYEAYALPVRDSRPDVALRLQTAIYHAFSDGTARDAYDAEFGMNREMSPSLKSLWALNGVFPPAELRAQVDLALAARRSTQEK